MYIWKNVFASDNSAVTLLNIKAYTHNFWYISKTISTSVFNWNHSWRWINTENQQKQIKIVLLTKKIVKGLLKLSVIHKLSNLSVNNS